MKTIITSGSSSVWSSTIKCFWWALFRTDVRNKPFGNVLIRFQLCRRPPLPGHHQQPGSLKDPTMPAQIWGNSGMYFLRAARAEPSSCQELPGKQHMGTKGCHSSDLSPQTSHQTRFPPPLPPTTSMKRKHMIPDMCSNTHTH